MTDEPTAATPSVGDDRIDSRAPRFGQGLTATLLVLAVVFQRPLVVYATAAILVVAVASRWRLDLYGMLWRTVRPIVGPPDETEHVAPPRFAKLLGAIGTILASALLAAGVPLAGYGVALVVATAGGLSATTGICLGCRFYRQVSFVRRLGIV